MLSQTTYYVRPVFEALSVSKLVAPITPGWIGSNTLRRSARVNVLNKAGHFYAIPSIIKPSYHEEGTDPFAAMASLLSARTRTRFATRIGVTIYKYDDNFFMSVVRNIEKDANPRRMFSY